MLLRFLYRNQAEYSMQSETFSNKKTLKPVNVVSEDFIKALPNIAKLVDAGTQFYYS